MIRAARPQDLSAVVGQTATGAWLPITQDRIRAFADVTEDHQWIHVDGERAASGPYGTTIAHGLLVLSLIPRLISGLIDVQNAAAVVNYGIDAVRFITPVPRDAHVRAVSELAAAEETSRGVRVHLRNTVELQGSERPALVAETIHLFIPTP